MSYPLRGKLRVDRELLRRFVLQAKSIPAQLANLKANSGPGAAAGKRWRPVRGTRGRSQVGINHLVD